mgnify:CR=1 FL=1
MIDLAVVTVAGEPVGRVCAVENYGATDIIEIEKADGAKFMVPLTKQAVPGWDDARLTLNGRDAGLTHSMADLIETEHDIAG